jgi:DNA-directed RNA polymerase
MTTTPVPALNPITRQVALEEDMRGQGTLRFKALIAKAREAGREAETPYGSQLISRRILDVSDGIKAFMKSVHSGAAGRRHTSAKFLEYIDPDTAAYLALKGVADGICGRLRFQAVAVKIGCLVEDEVRLRTFEEASAVNPQTGQLTPCKNYFRKVKKGLDEDSNHYRHKRQVLMHCMQKLGVGWEDWTPTGRLHLGAKLIEIVTETTGIVERIMLTSRKKSEYYLSAAPNILEEITKRCGEKDGGPTWTSWMSPLYQPMVVPPKDWTTPFDGGYLTHRTDLVKTRKPAYKEELASSDLGVIYHAVNGLQRTAWRINQAIYVVMAEAWKVGTGCIGGLPLRDHEEEPQKPHDIATNKEARKVWRRAAHQVKRRNYKKGSKVVQVAGIMDMAKKFLDEPALYFPYQLDFRGRVYSVPSGLTPQGHDIAKGLLTFSNGKPLGTQRAADWLAIHGANLFGYDKVSLEDRVKWVRDNQRNILQTVLSPLDFRWWEAADKPWQFLAFCHEWVGYMKEGLAFVSHLPIALDGSCNGLQHFSAMLRDPVGGAATNLTPTAKPQDIYQTVANRVIEKLKAKPDEELARKWLKFGITRKTTKRPVMVVPYGGTRHSCRDYILAHAKERIIGSAPSTGYGWEMRSTSGPAKTDSKFVRFDAESQLPPDANNPFITEKELYLACNYLSGLVWDAISETVVAARDAMAWLQKVSAVISEIGKPINWTSPTGFKAQQAYPHMKTVTVETKTSSGTAFANRSVRCIRWMS